VEEAALAWLESLGYTVKHGPDIALGVFTAEPGDYTERVLQDRQRDALPPRLISGELRVKDAERIITEAGA
jgi:type I restriction enzyme R subunit